MEDERRQESAWMREFREVRERREREWLEAGWQQEGGSREGWGLSPIPPAPPDNL